MGKYYKIFSSSLILLFLAGLSANADRVSGSTRAADKAVAEDSTAVNVPEGSIIDQVVWVVGDEAILKSDVEVMRLQSQRDNTKWKGNPDCAIPEQMAVQKLFVHQAMIDSVEVTESDVASTVERQINSWIAQVGSREKLEEYRKMTINQMRQEMHDDVKKNLLVNEMQRKIVENISVTPADVRKYFKNVPEDSIPLVPTEVEVEIITRQPKVAPEEIQRIKDELRDYTDRVNKGEASFSTLARLYSDDTQSAMQGGEIRFVGRAQLDPAFANVAFNLTDPKKVSKIVESDFGYHIIQLIEKNGDKINVRHILKKPHVTQEAIDSTCVLLDSLANDIRAEKFTFESAANPLISDDKETNNNHGLMYNTVYDEDGSVARTSRFALRDLPPEVARVVEGMNVGDVSKAFSMKNEKDKDVCAIVCLKSRRPEHRANINEDFQTLKGIVLNKKRNDAIHDWVVKTIKNTYVKMSDKYKNCDFEYQGWVK